MPMPMQRQNGMWKLISKGTRRKKPWSVSEYPQGDLFAAAPEAREPEEHPMLPALRDLQPDEMNPKEALEWIYQLKKLVQHLPQVL